MKLTSYSVLARQGSSFCNRARECLSFALNDIKMAATKICRLGSKCGLSLTFLITEQFFLQKKYSFQRMGAL